MTSSGHLASSSASVAPPSSARSGCAGAGTGGPFVNRNHFAGYMEMLIPIPLALALSRATRGEARVFYGFAAAKLARVVQAYASKGEAA